MELRPGPRFARTVLARHGHHAESTHDAPAGSSGAPTLKRPNVFWNNGLSCPVTLRGSFVRDGSHGVGPTRPLRPPERAVARLRLRWNVVRKRDGPAVVCAAANVCVFRPLLARFHVVPGSQHAVRPLPYGRRLLLGAVRADGATVRARVARKAVRGLPVLLAHGGPAPATEAGTTGSADVGAIRAAISATDGTADAAAWTTAASATSYAAATASWTADAAAAAAAVHACADAMASLSLPSVDYRATAWSCDLNRRPRASRPASLGAGCVSRGKTWGNAAARSTLCIPLRFKGVPCWRGR